MWITRSQMGEEQLLGDIRKLAMVTQILHMPLTLLIEWLKHAVG